MAQYIPPPPQPITLVLTREEAEYLRGYLQNCMYEGETERDSENRCAIWTALDTGLRS